jgi:hypothetical protein
MRLVLQHRIGQLPEHDTAGQALCPDRKIELAVDRSAEGLGFQHHDPRWHTNDVIELDRPTRAAENDTVKRGEPDSLYLRSDTRLSPRADPPPTCFAA